MPAAFAKCERIAYARKAKLPDEGLLELILQDESRPTRPSQSATASHTRLLHRGANLREFRLGDAPVGFDRHRVRDLCLLFIDPRAPNLRGLLTQTLSDLGQRPPFAIGQAQATLEGKVQTADPVLCQNSALLK